MLESLPFVFFSVPCRVCAIFVLWGVGSLLEDVVSRDMNHHARRQLHLYELLCLTAVLQDCVVLKRVPVASQHFPKPSSSDWLPCPPHPWSCPPVHNWHGLQHLLLNLSVYFYIPAREPFILFLDDGLLYVYNWILVYRYRRKRTKIIFIRLHVKTCWQEYVCIYIICTVICR